MTIVKHKKQKRSFWYLVICAVLVGFCLLCVLPLLHVLAYSLNDGLDGQKGGIVFWPRVFSLDNYKKMFEHRLMGSAYSITIFRTVAGTVLGVLLNAAYAYALSRRKLIARKFFTWITILPMYFTAGLIPFYLVLYTIKITNTLWVYIIPAIYSSFHIVVYRTFYRSIPESVIESASMDGAGDFMIFTRFMLPLSLPVIATIALFTGVGQWNDWFVGMTYIFKQELWPVQTLLMYILKSADSSEYMDSYILLMRGKSSSTATPEAIKMAMIIISTAPILAIYPFLQRYFIVGLSVGSIKE
ncbi:MAG TPA: carbohydrate ABC transporter permease [Clostridia bacterium]|nr:carbohydrate ABC transporter permease [Clostridia bacterium]